MVGDVKVEGGSLHLCAVSVNDVRGGLGSVEAHCERPCCVFGLAACHLALHFTNMPYWSSSQVDGGL